jgi:phage/plasmid-like protein (TIGR03299 family)
MEQAVVRGDTAQVLGTVGPAWKPVQNRQAFGFLDAVAGERRIEYHTAGALGTGERVWMLAKLPDLLRVGSTDDVVEKFLLLSNNHDGRASMRVLWTPTRVVCQNTLSVALRDGEGQGIAIRHSGDLEGKVREAQRVLGLAERFYDDLKPRIDRLAQFSPDHKQLSGYFAALYPDPDDVEESKRAANRAKEVRDVLHGLFSTGMGHDMPGIEGSMWAAYNAVTEYIDHNRPVRGESKLSSEVGASKKLESIWWGQGAQVKRDAWSLACELAGCN